MLFHRNSVIHPRIPRQVFVFTLDEVIGVNGKVMDTENNRNTNTNTSLTQHSMNTTFPLATKSARYHHTSNKIDLDVGWTAVQMIWPRTPRTA